MLVHITFINKGTLRLKMKILAFVDLHGLLDILSHIREKIKKEKVELVLCGGDISVFGQKTKTILERMDKLGPKVLLIHGNHEDAKDLKEISNKFRNIEFIHQSSYIIEKNMFFGYGGDGFSKRDETFVRVAKKLKKHYATLKKKHPDFKLIMLLHGPPFNTKVDDIAGNHVGNKDYTEFIQENSPELVLCGHLHENAGKSDKIGKTKVINPGPEGKIIEV